MQNSNTFFEHLYRSFGRSFGPLTAIISLGLAILTYFIVPTEKVVTTRWLIIVILLSSYLVFGLLHATYAAFYSDRDVLPSVRYASPPPKAFPLSFALLLIEPSMLFSYNSVVGVYSVENELERLIGIGTVFNIQEDKRIQVLVTQDVDFGNEWKSLINNEVKLSSIRVKPYIPAFVVETKSNEPRTDS